MTKTREWPVRVMYMLIAAALAISLMITAAPAQRVDAATDEADAEWTRVSTPTVDGFVMAPNCTIIDYYVAEGGDVAYAILYAGGNLTTEESEGPYFLLKSENGAATWKDITKGVKKEIVKKNLGGISELLQVACDPEDPDFVSVALSLNTSINARVFVSKDSGDTFEDAKEVADGSIVLPASGVFDLEVSLQDADGERNIAISGTNSTTPPNEALLFRCTATGDSATAWEDATDTTTYKGWDDDGEPTAFASAAVVDIKFSPNWKSDKTILVVTVTQYGSGQKGNAHLQTGTWGSTTQGWNKKSSANIAAVLLNETGTLSFPKLDGLTAGITLPSDYSGKPADKKMYAWVWVNYYDASKPGNPPAATIFRVEDDSADPIGYQVKDGQLWLTNVSYWGTVASGTAIAGVLGDGTGNMADCCTGVEVYRYDNIDTMDVCCPRWEDACKLPTGRYAMDAFFVREDKAYAVALNGTQAYEEGAWSVSFNSEGSPTGNDWNQLSLIDTNIDYLSDVAVSPDCNKTMLVSVNLNLGCECDSVWLHAVTLPEAEEYSGYWLRTWCDRLVGDNPNDFFTDLGLSFSFPERGLLRLAPEETTGDTVFMVDRMTDTVYWNDLETWNCWNQLSSPPIEISEIVDLAVKDKDTIYVLDEAGYVAMYNAEEEWQSAVKSEVRGNGWTIAAHGDYVLVGGQNGKVSYSDDSGDTFTKMEKDVALSGYVTVAFDTYFDTNNTIYAALADAGTSNGIYRLVIDESKAWEDLEWKDLNALPYDYTGLVLDRPGEDGKGNPMTSADTGGILYASYYDRGGTFWWDSVHNDSDLAYTGVARCLKPAEDVCCGENVWDYLIETEDNRGLEAEIFCMAPQALKICGCTEADSPNELFAIDAWAPSGYDMDEGKDGTVWTFVDCQSKKGVELTSPADGFLAPTDPCCAPWCRAMPFALVWDRLCDACEYDIEFALDEEFTQIWDWWYYYEPEEPATPNFLTDGVECGLTIYWRIRSAVAESGQEIHSWWSEVRTFTVASTPSELSIDLIAPEPDATDVAVKNVGFSWSEVTTANKYDWVLDDNADFSSPTDSQTGLTTTAYGCTQTLEYDTTYYWQVTAWKDSAKISTSAVGTFRTAIKTVPPGEVPPAPTPTWVWVVIAIGAVLVIVVIVLIFRTRRV